MSVTDVNDRMYHDWKLKKLKNTISVNKRQGTIAANQAHSIYFKGRNFCRENISWGKCYKVSGINFENGQ